ncbi:MAG: hypothetical protein VB084_08290 [Syntrophomonadaceae bacterium]|nr:hypothetical protein [Syntrophomonadaceae bacterium]
MNEMICPLCGKFLGVLDGIAQIKCPRCLRLSTYESKHSFDSDPDEKASKQDAESTKIP